jgi:hypothetical protein
VAGAPSLDPGASAIEGIERVVPGSALTVDVRGTNSSTRFWTFSPFWIPRELGFEAAQAEVRAVLRRTVTNRGVVVHATTPARRVLLEVLPLARPFEGPARVLGAPEILRAAASVDHPLALDRLAELTPVLLDRNGLRASDLGARELFGATPGAIEAWLHALARLLGSGARPAVLARAVTLGLPVDRALEEPVFVAEIASRAKSILGRWAGALPERARTAIARAAAQNGAAKEESSDPFIARRFLESESQELQAANAALAERGALAPFLDPSMIELVFSLPSRFFIADGRAMALLEGGLPIRAAAAGPPAPPPAWAEPWIARARSALDLDRRPSARSKLHRLAGLGVFLESLAR